MAERLGQTLCDFPGGYNDAVHLPLGVFGGHRDVTGVRTVGPRGILLLRGVEVHGRGSTACRVPES